MTVQLRSLATKDIFPMSKILKKIGLRQIMADAAANLDKVKGTSERAAKNAQMALGAMIVGALLEELHKAEDEVTALLASLAGISVEEFAELPLEDSLAAFDQLREQRVFKSFLQLAGK